MNITYLCFLNLQRAAILNFCDVLRLLLLLRSHFLLLATIFKSENSWYSCYIIPAIKSDHSAVTLFLNSLDKQHHGPSHWRFNISLLEYSSFAELMTLKYSE